VPLPVPLAPAVIVIQDTLLAAVHVQPAAVVMVALAVAAPLAAVCESGTTLKVHEPACVTVIVWPAIVSVPARAPDPMLAASE
jgi:hypothetical protein